MSILPTRNNILVKRLPSKKQTNSGIILKSSEEPDLGFVISVGTEVTNVTNDSKVLVDWNKAIDIYDDDKYIISEDNVIAIID